MHERLEVMARKEGNYREITCGNLDGEAQCFEATARNVLANEKIGIRKI